MLWAEEYLTDGLQSFLQSNPECGLRTLPTAFSEHVHYSTPHSVSVQLFVVVGQHSRLTFFMYLQICQKDSSLEWLIKNTMGIQYIGGSDNSLWYNLDLNYSKKILSFYFQLLTRPFSAFLLYIASVLESSSAWIWSLLFRTP